MNANLKQSEKMRQDTMRTWLQQVIPEFYNLRNELSPEPGFENPLLYQVIREFQKLFDYIFSEDSNTNVPVAETLIKFKALSPGISEDVIRYPVVLKNCILENLDNQTPFEDILLAAIYQKTEELLTGACMFYLKTREDIYNIKMKELQNGVFSTASLGSKAAVCPSSFINEMPPQNGL